jgi:cell division protein FtsZ
MAHDVFISYSSRDKPVADAVCAHLERDGVRCWMAPRDILPGQEYGAALVEAIESSKLIALVLSRNSASSPQVLREIERAVHKGLAILPLRIDEVVPAGSLEFFISTTHWLDALTPPLEQHLARMVNVARELLRTISSTQRIFSSSARATIGVIALGGGAIRAGASLLNLYSDTLRLIACHTYLPTLEKSDYPTKIQLGNILVGGQNSGGDPQIGKQAAEEAADIIIQSLTGLRMVFVISCLGGGTGTGAAPVVCSRAREMGILTLGIVTTPFHMEGSRRGKVSEQGISELITSTDSLIVIPNQALLERGIPSQQAFSNSNLAVALAVRTVTDVIFLPGLVNVDFADIAMVFRNGGIGRFGYGRCNGENAPVLAAKTAISSPTLMGTQIQKAQSIVINITVSSGTTLHSIAEAMSLIQNDLNEDALMVFGSVIDESLSDNTFIVTLIASSPHDELIATSNAKFG